MPSLRLKTIKGGLLVLKKEKNEDLGAFLEALYVKASKTNVRFLLDMNYNRGCTPEKLYPICGQ